MHLCGGVREAFRSWMEAARSPVCGGVPAACAAGPSSWGVPGREVGSAGCGMVSTTMWLRPVWNSISRSYLRTHPPQ
jgi:hypothetical protein